MTVSEKLSQHHDTKCCEINASVEGIVEPGYFHLKKGRELVPINNFCQTVICQHLARLLALQEVMGSTQTDSLGLLYYSIGKELSGCFKD